MITLVSGWTQSTHHATQTTHSPSSQPRTEEEEGGRRDEGVFDEGKDEVIELERWPIEG